MSSADGGGIYIDMIFYINFTFSTYDIGSAVYEPEILAQSVTHVSPSPIPSCGPQEYTYQEDVKQYISNAGVSKPNVLRLIE